MTIKLLLLAGQNKSELVSELHAFLADHGQAIAAVVLPDSYKHRYGCRKAVGVSRELGIPTITTFPAQLSKAVIDLNFNMIFLYGYHFKVAALLINKISVKLFRSPKVAEQFDLV